jgi:hypothetical protein
VAVLGALLLGLALVLLAAFALSNLKFNGTYPSTNLVDATPVWVLAAAYAAAIASWWALNLRTPILLLSHPLAWACLVGLGVELVGLGTLGKSDVPMLLIVMIAFTLMLLFAALAGLVAGFTGLEDRPEERVASVVIPLGIALLALVSNATLAACVLAGIATLDFLVPTVSAWRKVRRNQLDR